MRLGFLRRGLFVVGCGVMAVSLSACESTQQESEKIGREGGQSPAASASLKLGAVNRSVRISDVTLLSSSGRKAVAARLTSTSAKVQSEIPLLVTVTGKGGKVLYTNATGEQEDSLQHLSLLRPGQSVWWVDDQVLTSQTATAVRIQAGTGRATRAGSVPDLTTTGVSNSSQGGLALVSGNVVNHSSRPLSKVPVFVVSLRGRAIVAAGRAVIPALAGQNGASALFEAFLVGAPGPSTQLNVVASAG
jgi:hypothetical protein